MNRNNVGIIAEDISDVNSIQIIIKRIKEKNNIGFKHFVGRGHGKIINKCNEWADQLFRRGCYTLIIIHDSDDNSPKKIFSMIKSLLNFCPFKKYLISIPIQELETWLLSDPVAIKKSVNLIKEPKIKGSLETINSPKEYLGKVILCNSNKQVIYLNTKHNEKIAENVSLEMILQKCPSFLPFYEFVQKNIN